MTRLAVLLVVLLVPIVVYAGAPGTEPRDRAPTPDALATDTPPADATPPAPEGPPAAIHLVGDAAIAQAATRRGWPGSGHQDDPYRIRDLEVFTDGRDGIRIEATQVHILVTGNTIETFGGAAIRIVDAQNVTVHDNTLVGDEAGIVFEGGQGNEASTNRVTGQADGIRFTGGRGHSATDNVLDDQRHAIRIDPRDGLDAVGHQVMRNQVRDRDAATDGERAGIFATGQGHHVTDNRFERTGTAALWIRDAHDLTVRDNRFEGDARHALYVQHATGGTLKANVFAGGHRTAIAVEDSIQVAIRDNAIAAPHGAGMTFARTQALEVHDNTIETSRQGIVAWEDTRSLMRANRLVSVDRPIDLYDCIGTRISTNWITDAVDAAVLARRCHDLEVHANHIGYSAGSALFLYNGTSLVVRENVIAGVPWGMVVDEVEGIEITRNILRGSGPMGISLEGSRGRLIDNELLSYEVGLRIHDAPAVRVQGGSASFSGWGVVLSGASAGVELEGMRVQENRYGVAVFETEAPQIRGNTIEDNVYGIVLDGPDRAVVASNRILQNEVGLFLGNTSAAEVWDNLFDNTVSPRHRDVRIIGSTDTLWNVTKRPGENVVGGHFIGGNAWHDYNGADVDLDGLGDSPYLPAPCRDLFADPDCAHDIMPLPLDLLPLMERLVPEPLPVRGDRPASPALQLSP